MLLDLTAKKAVRKTPSLLISPESLLLHAGGMVSLIQGELAGKEREKERKKVKKGEGGLQF